MRHEQQQINADFTIESSDLPDQSQMVQQEPNGKKGYLKQLRKNKSHVYKVVF